MPAQAAIGRIATDGKPSFKIGMGGSSIQFSTMRVFQLKSVTDSMAEPNNSLRKRPWVGSLLRCGMPAWRYGRQ